jgi:hypothetical protein
MSAYAITLRLSSLIAAHTDIPDQAPLSLIEHREGPRAVGFGCLQCMPVKVLRIKINAWLCMLPKATCFALG